RPWCDAEVALDRLEVSHLSVGPDGPRRALYEGPGLDGQVLRLVAQRMEAGEGRRLEAELNQLWPGAPAVAGFVRPAIYAPEPLGTLPELCMEFFSHLPGVPLSTLVAADAFPRLCERAAASLLHFHTVPVALGWERGVAANVAKVTDRAVEFATLFPDERQRI